MKFRVISDLHIDVNHRHPFQLKEMDNDITTLVAGDVSGDPSLDYEWLQNNTNLKGYVVSGNHIVYNDKDKTVPELQDLEKELFSKSNRWQYLEKDYKILEDEKIIIFGATLWTDYLYNGDEVFNMWSAKLGLNDFRFGMVENADGERVELFPKWCKDEHIKTLEKLDKVCKDYPDYSVIVLTHHCPTGKSVMPQYVNAKTNAAFVSDLTKFIEDHKNIKAWICGHVHTPHSYDVGNCTVIANPMGYTHYGENTGWDMDTMNFELKDGKVVFEKENK